MEPPATATDRVDGPPPGDVVVLTDADRTLVMLHGEIDHRVSDDLEDAARYCVDAGLRAQVDVRRVSAMDSVGLAFIVRLAAALSHNGAELVLHGPSRQVQDLIELVEAGPLVRWLFRTDDPQDQP